MKSKIKPKMYNGFWDFGILAIKKMCYAFFVVEGKLKIKKSWQGVSFLGQNSKSRDSPT